MMNSPTSDVRATRLARPTHTAGRTRHHTKTALIAVLLIWSALHVGAAPASAELSYPRPANAIERALASDFHRLVNVERAARGLPPLDPSPDPLDRWGFYRAQYTHDHCSESCHARPSNQEDEDLLPEGWAWAGEVSFGHIPRAQYSIGDALIGFMRSSGHRDILLASSRGMVLATGVVCQAGEMTVVTNILVREGRSAGVTSTPTEPVATRPGSGESCGWRKHWAAAADGTVFARGGEAHHGSAGGVQLSKPIVDIEATSSRRGYWLLGADGGVFTFGDAPFFGSTGDLTLNQPVVAMAATPSGQGYWLVAADGGIFAYGDAVFYGSTGGMRLNKPVVGIAAAPDGKGYWLVAADGGIFTFGPSAAFHGSTGNLRLNREIVGMAPGRGGGGYALVAADGGVFTFGDAPFHGAAPTRGDVVDVAPIPSGTGYFVGGAGGRVVGFGDAIVRSNEVVIATSSPIVGIAS